MPQHPCSMAEIATSYRATYHQKKDVSVLTALASIAGLAVEVGRARILSAACSAAMTIMADGFPVMWPGKMEASTTKTLSMPYTFVLVSTTAVPLALRPSSRPIFAVPIQWLAQRRAGVAGIWRIFTG